MLLSGRLEWKETLYLFEDVSGFDQVNNCRACCGWSWWCWCRLNLPSILQQKNLRSAVGDCGSLDLFSCLRKIVRGRT